MSYLRWNDALAKHFFRPEMAGKPVYLHVNEELIADLARELGRGSGDFIASIRRGPPWTTRQGICQKALQAYDGWRWRGLWHEFPPYIGYVSFFVLAAGSEGDWAAHAYYPRAWNLLGEDRTGMLPSFDRMVDLWDDLEQWSAKDKAGELGLFKARSVGGWIHVGYPVGQVILTEHERKALPSIFAAAELDPSSVPSQAQLASALRLHGAGRLRQRTLRVLAEGRGSELWSTLLGAVAEELADWNGEIPAGGSPEAHLARVFGALRLCLRVDSVAGKVHAELRCKLNHEYPDGGLQLNGAAAGALTCDELVEGWSSPLKYADTGRTANAADFDWTHGITLHDANLGWQVRLPGASVRLLENGLPRGLPGLVEIQELPYNQRVHLLFHSETWPDLEAWVTNSCQGFKEVPAAVGLPSGWRLASIERVIDDAQVRNRFPVLSFAGLLRLTLKRGIRSGPGNNYFAYAPPDVVLLGGRGDETVNCDNAPLVASGPGIFSLPENSAADRQIVIEVWRGSELLKRLSLYLTSGVTWQGIGALGRLDKWGDFADSDAGQGVAGATIKAASTTEAGYRPSPFLARGLSELRRGSVLFLGQVPGQVTSWPASPLPRHWSPVWAVAGRRKKRAIYCGGDLSEAAPCQAPAGEGQNQLQVWKQALWQRRKRIVAPANPLLANLWRQYQECARNV